MVESSENPLLDIGTTTSTAFNIMKNKEKNGKAFYLGKSETLERNPNKKVIVYVYTPQDKQKHTYFHSLSIDKQVEDFMGTAELRCPYDSDLMEYWEPIRNYCAIYGSNTGKNDLQILFIGRVRELRQEGYELVITFQDYGWKFKQMVTQSYANDNVINKDGYTIMKLMFEALKIDSWVISPIAKNRLKQVGYDEDGNVVLNKQKLEKMPDLLERLKASNPNDTINKWTVQNKQKESELHNIKNINYTLKYEKPTARMKKIASEGATSSGFTPGTSMYGTNYGASGGSGGGGGSGNSGLSASGTPRPPDNLCSNIGDSAVIAAMKLVWSFNGGYANDYSSAKDTIVNFARNHPQTYSSRASPCLATLSKRLLRSDRTNAAAIIKNVADGTATSSGISMTVTTAVSVTQNAIRTVGNIANNIVKGVQGIGKSIQSFLFG